MIKDYALYHSFFKPYKKQILKVLFYYSLTLVASVFIPYFLGDLIHALELGVMTKAILFNKMVVIVILYVLWNIASYFSDVNFEFLNKSIENDIREHCFKKILNSSISSLNTLSSGEIISRIINDSKSLEAAFSNLFKLMMSVLRSVFLFIIMFIINKTLSWAILILYLIVVLIQKRTSKVLKSAYKDCMNSEETLLCDLETVTKGFKTIKIFSLEKDSLNILQRNNATNLSNHMYVSKKKSRIVNLNFFISGMFRVSAVLGGSLLYLSGQIYIGNIFTIYSYAIQLSGELRSIIEADIILNHAIASFERINELLNIIDGHTNTSKRTVEQVRSIEAKSLDFSYENNNILNQLSFSAARNEIIGVKGANGTGKSTLLNLICGINKSPKLSINSEPMTNLSEASLLGQISYVPQETFLFPVSIMDNLTCFNRIDKDKVYSVCKSLGIHDRLEKMPMGYETTINEKNSNLSLGERQLVSIARALLKPCDILILDEFNSALDSKIEERLIHSMKPFLKDKIVFIVSHKPNIFDICDKVLDLDS